MSFLSKLAFWKKKDDLDFDNLDSPAPLPTDNLDLNQPDLGLDEPSLDPNPPIMPDHPEMPSPSLPPQQPQAQGNSDLDLISSKLDTLKAMLTSMEQRIANLERAAGVEQQRKLW